MEARRAMGILYIADLLVCLLVLIFLHTTTIWGRMQDLKPTPEVLRALRQWIEKTCRTNPTILICQKRPLTDDDLRTYLKEAQDLENLCEQPWTTCQGSTVPLRINAPYLNKRPARGPNLPPLFKKYCPASLRFVNFSHNVFDGEFPVYFHHCLELEMLDLSYNRFKGPIPAEIRRLSKLRLLDLSHNQFDGSLPRWINALGKLRYLYLSHNRFAGQVPAELGMLSELRVLDVSSNVLTGRVPDNPVFRRLDFVRCFANNAGLCGWIRPPCPGDDVALPKPPPAKKPPAVLIPPVGERSAGKPPPAEATAAKPPGRKPAPPGKPNVTARQIGSGPAPTWRRLPKAVVPIIVAIVAVVVSLALFCLFRLWCRRTVLRKDTYKITVATLKAATGDFADENHVGLGSRYDVYRGVLGDETEVAVKIVRKELRKQIRPSFVDSCKSVVQLEHKNVARVLGWCDKRDFLSVVVEWKGNGSLQDWLLHPRNPPSWSQRFHVALQIANALSYLDRHCPTLHWDLKSRNILLDEDFGACVSDFQLRAVNSDPDEGSSPASDNEVYGYGLLLLELTINKRPVEYLIRRLRKKFPGRAHTMMDPVIHRTARKGDQRPLQLMDVALICVADLPDRRPRMKSVLSMLKKVRNLTWVVHDGKWHGSHAPKAATRSRAVRHNSMLIEPKNGRRLRSAKVGRLPFNQSVDGQHSRENYDKIKALNNFAVGSENGV